MNFKIVFTGICCCISACIILVLWRQGKSKKSRQKILSERLLAILPTLVSLVMWIAPTGNEIQPTLDIQNGDYNINIDGSHYGDIIQYRNGAHNEKEFTEHELLTQAEIAFDTADYAQSLQILLRTELKDNSIALINLSYFYLNGVYVDKNIDLAEDYLLKARQLGNVEAEAYILNLMIHKLDNADKIYDQIRKCYNSQSERAAQLIVSICDTNIQAFLEMDADSAKSIIRSKFFVSYVAIEEHYSALNGSAYDLISMTEDEAGRTVRVYKVFKTKAMQNVINTYYRT